MVTLKSCPVCGSVLIAEYHLVGINPRVIHEIMPGLKLEAGIISYYFVCQSCNLIFQNPRMRDAELDKFYGQGYYRRIVARFDKEMDAGEEYRAKIDAEIIKRHMGKIESHLDIGCSRGYLLDAVGATLRVGVESNVSYVRAKGVKVYPEMNRVPQKSFDLVTAIHVLEHVPSLLDYLKSMAKFVSKSGHLIIEVPTWESQGGPLRLQHLYHFEPDVLRLMCKQVGLRVVQTEFTPHLMLICRLNNNS